MQQKYIITTLAVLGAGALLIGAKGEATDRPGTPITLPHEPVLHLVPAPLRAPGDPETRPPASDDAQRGPIEGERILPTTANAPWTPEGDVRLDRDTRQEGDLRYEVVFSPSVAPWKRSGARGQVHADPDGTLVLGLSDLPRSVVPVGGEPAPSALTFVGRVQVDLEPGVPAPIPSTSPCMRIHDVRSWPPVPLSWLKDGDDNFWVQSTNGGSVELEFTVSSSAAYFGLGPPSGHMEPPATVTPSAAHRLEALELLQIADISSDLDAGRQVDALANWLRSFESGTPPSTPTIGSTLLDLGTHQLGVCRHRAFLFVVVTQALGIPARYVFNEAHAFAEIYAPVHGWVRVDLGGDARSLTLDGDHETDPLPSSDGATDPHRVVTGRPLSDSNTPAPSTSTPDASSITHTAEDRRVDAPQADISPTPPTPAPPPRTARRIHLETTGSSRQPMIWRLGEDVLIEGRLVATSGDLPAQVDIWLDAAGDTLTAGVSSIRVGSVPVEGGSIRWSQPLPTSWIPGEWRIRIEPVEAAP